MTEVEVAESTSAAPISGETILDRAIAQITDQTLRDRIAREVELLRGSRRFGLVFDRHLPESVRLRNYPIRKGVKVTLRDESIEQTWRVVRFTDLTRQVVVLDDDTERPAADLVVIREFGEPIYPGLRSVECIANGRPEEPVHIVINGENYHALQALRTTHRGKVDLIYIDIPYNTGNEGWIYNDRYVDANDRAKSSKWLSFIERRLEIAKHLLKPTGVIIVAIGDHEHHRLRMLMDQVFGANNFLANVVWQGNVKNDARFGGGGLDYMVIYARSADVLVAADVRWLEAKPDVDLVFSAAMDAWVQSEEDAAAATRIFKKWWSSLPKGSAVLASKHYAYVDDVRPGEPYFAAPLMSPNYRTNLVYELRHPVTDRPFETPKNGWRYAPDSMEELIQAGGVHFGKDESTLPMKKVYLRDVSAQVPFPSFRADRRSGGKHVDEVLGEKRFPFPKNHEVLMRWIRMLASTDAVVLDFFGGSGTTTEAVIRLNAEDGGRRQSILVTNNEVGPKTAKALRANGRHAGDPQWEARGVFEYVARPRISTVVNGTRPDGSAYSDGLPANVEFFDLRYLDPGMVRRGREFEAIAPLLWMESGATGERIDVVAESGWAMADNYAVLFDIDAAKPLIDAVTERAKAGSAPDKAFIITDSVAAFQTVIERLPSGVMPVRLFEDYLTNFTANTDGAAAR